MTKRPGSDVLSLGIFDGGDCVVNNDLVEHLVTKGLLVDRLGRKSMLDSTTASKTKEWM